MTAFVRRWRAHLFAAAVVAGLSSATLARTSVLAAAVGVSLVAGSALLGPRLRVAAVALALFLAAWWWGSVRLDALDRSVLAREVGAAGDALVTITAPARRSKYDVRVSAQLRSFRGRSVRERVQLELPPGRAPPQGALVAAFVHVSAPDRRPEFDERTWLARRGVHVVARATDWRVVGARGGVGGLADRLRRALVRGLAGLTGERRAVLAGIVLGEDEGLGDGLEAAFRASGLYHLLAVSGQNIAYLAVGVGALGWLFGVPRRVAEVGLLAVIGGYVLAVGWQPSVVRAGVAGALASLAWLTARERDRWWLFLAGGIVLLAWNPYSLYEPGFQLSFAAVAAIFVGVPRILDVLEGYPVPRPLALVVALSLACGVATAPILWAHFGAVPLFSIVANALAAPVVGALLGLALLAALLAPILPAAALALAWIDGWLAAYLIACARLVASLPFAQIGGRGLVALVAISAAISLFARLRAPRPLRAVVLLSVCSLVVVAWSARDGDVPPPPNGLRVTFLDVGQGDGIVVQAPGVAMLVDQGPPEANVARQLRRLGIRRLDLLVLTHPQRDHVGGAAQVVRELEVRAVLDPMLASTGPEREAAVAEARRRHVRVLAARAGGAFGLGPLRIAVLWPDGPGSRSEDPNNRAIVLVVSYRDADVLLTADAESNVTLPLDLPDVELLKVAHHGSVDDGLAELLERTKPEVAVISVGLGNDYGHPAPSTLHTLTTNDGLRLARTDLDGRVVVESDGRRLWVEEER